MAWSAQDLSAAMSSAEYADYSSFRPVLLTHNAITSGFWSTSSSSASDNTDTSYPAARAYDDQLHLETRPSPDASTIYFPCTLDTSVPFDAFVYDGMPAMAQGYTLSLEIADDLAFSTNLQALVSFGVNAGVPTIRQYIRTLAHTGAAKRYSGTAYARIKIVSGSGNFNPKPRLTEFFLGRTHQMEAWPESGAYAQFEQLSEFEEFRSKSGVVTRYERLRGQRRFAGSLLMTEADSWNRMLRYFKESGFGRRNTWVVETPSTAVFLSTDFSAQGAYPILCASPTSMVHKIQGPYKRVWDFEFLENGPFFAPTQFTAV